ncbi:MAG: ATP-dependent zinc metalloprotease FtsH [Bacteroidales bacterium]|jgi:cell division protease FtsH|nr:ATP-dependent zinc metalloprotease FtsH [Bacteroidales bacterium]MDD4641054.1 ATP-dependent zinc metalloprotease FtsH [Bacteroidales bacterium]
MSEIQRPKDIKPKPKFNIYWIYALILIGLFAVQFLSRKEVSKEITWTEMEEHLVNNRVEEMLCINQKNQVKISIREEALVEVFGEDVNKEKSPVLFVEIPSAERFSEFIEQFKKTHSLEINVKYDNTSNTFLSVLLNLAPFILLIVIWVFIMRRMAGGGAGGAGGGAGGIFSVGKSKARLFEKGGENPITFKDVAGLSEAKQEVEEIVAFLKNPSKYTELGGKIPKGALLVGPPGTGKTLLAKAVAGEADVPFFSLSGSDFVEMFVGVGASRVRDLFRQAKEKAPCIVFIDEIDAVGRARGKNPNMGANDERENTLNQLLTEMDGFGSNSGVIILAATNRVDVLDKALLRAGRFDRQISVDLPDINERHEIFLVHLRPIKTDESLDSEYMARQTPGFSGADIANVCNEAALIAARKGKSHVQKQDFLDAVDRIIGGLEKKNKITTAEERRSIAIHEAGHASLSWLLEYAHPLIKVTIVPRGKALGAAWYLPEERQLTTKEQMLDEMCSALGGRAAEELFIGKISSGALNDLEKITKQAYAMVAYFGMSDKLNNLSYFDSSGSSEYSFSKPYSEKTAELIDKEVKALVDEQYQRAKKILSEHKEGHQQLANILVEREVIFSEDMEHIFGKRKWVSRMEEMIESQKQQNNKNKSESSSSNNDTVSEQAEETADEEYSSEPTESENLPDKE